MQFTTLFTLAGLAVLASAQQTHTVLVGDGGALAFSPSNITGVSPGDKVSFEFRAKNHTATQSTFTAPCVPGTFNGSAGADSGFAFIPPNNTLQAGQFPTWTITVNSTAPIWFHCAQTNPKSHCQAGMVFSINANAEKSFDAFLANAKAFVPSTVSAGSTSTTDPSVSGSNSTSTTDPSISGSNSTSVSSDPSAAGSSINGTSIGVSSETLVPASAAPAAASSGVANAGAASADQSNSNTTATPKGNGAVSVGVSKAAGLLVAVVFGAVLI
jgi:plastocyanin